MKDKPELQLVGHDGNIFAVMGSAGRLLRRAGLHEEADEMLNRVQSCKDYYEALSIVSQYVDTELSSGGKGFIETEDITVDRDSSRISTAWTHILKLIVKPSKKSIR